MITLICCLLVSFIGGFLLALNFTQANYESRAAVAGTEDFMSLLSNQGNTFSLMSLVLLLLFTSSEESANSFYHD